MPDTNAPVEVPDDSIGGALRAAFEKHSEPIVAPEAGKVVEKPAADATATTPAAKPGDKVVEKPAVDAAATPATAAPVETPEQTAQRARTDHIPHGWKGGAAAWHAQAPEIKQYVADTIRNASVKIQEQAPAVKFANEIASVFGPHEGFLRAQNTNPVAATQWLLDGYMALRTGSSAQKYQIIQNLAAEAGIDLASIQAGDVPKVDPEMETLRSELRQLRTERDREKQTAQSAESSQLQADLQAFENDPAHEHFQVVRGQMGALLMAGQAKDLQDAYDKACWAHPDIRSSLVHKQIAQETEKRKKEAEQAQRAGVSLTGAPSSGGAPNLGDMSLREALEHQFQGGARA